MAKSKCVHMLPPERSPITSDKGLPFRENPERRKRYKKEYYSKNKESISCRKKTYRDKNKEKILQKKRQESQSIRDFLIAIKEQNPCTDCRGHFPHYVMEFDHVIFENNNRNVSSIRGWPSLLKEIAKCEIVCANCHRIRTHIRGQFITSRRKA